nr:MAG TPA: hypothetical protein [Caudoviricetes sp.]
MFSIPIIYLYVMEINNKNFFLVCVKLLKKFKGANQKCYLLFVYWRYGLIYLII